ncbi:MAG TPA: UDP-N-acetylmuramoyl-tripeptide--D-alanyl-D-alanine ligase [Actinomycetota bacterium]|nr:UDP-N-acetylmuramoyl-tripeptide--D-alanyl-D-alanine ligase [Actinomycetota bacterium]
MIARPLSTIAEEVGGRLVGADAQVTDVVTDSRMARPGALFVALRGERADGADFVDDAFRAGAVGAIVPEGTASAGQAILVGSTDAALVRLGAAEARRLTARVVAVTGANGKTSTKDMTAAVASVRFVTHASPGSFNNEIGLPMTLLGATAETEVIVAEMGARRKGDVAALCEIVRPSIVVVTNVGLAHLEIFGSWDAIVEAAAEPVEALAPDGWAVLNTDDPVVSGLGSRHPGRVVTFGEHPGADVRAADVSMGEDGAASFTLQTDEGRAPVTLAVAGEHMVPDALAAAAVGSILGVPLEEVARALCSATVSRWRMETFSTSGGVVVINDAYNANPESMAAALKAARAMARGGRMIAVLGHMAELGPIADEEHERLGALAARLRVDRLVAVGEPARLIAMAAVREGSRPDDVAAYDDAGDALSDVRAQARSGDVVLVKGSRVAGLESLAEALR